MEIITFNDCRKCGSKPRVRAFGSLHLVTCPECLEETLSDPDLAVLAKRWNELNPARPVEITLSKAFSPIKEIRLTARIDDLDLETEPESESESESESETDLAPESEPVIPEYCAANLCKCGGGPVYFQTRSGQHFFICRECGQIVSDHIAYSGLVAKWNELNPSGWSHATAFSENPKFYVWNHGGDPDQENDDEEDDIPMCECCGKKSREPGCDGWIYREGGRWFCSKKCMDDWYERMQPIKPAQDPETETEPEAEPDLVPESEPMLSEYCDDEDPEEGPRDPNIPPVHPIHRCSCGGEPEFYSLLNGPIYFICNKCRKRIFGFKPFSEMIADWNKANPLDETERPNLDPGRGPCTCQGFDSPLQYQVGGDHYRRFNYQPVMFFRETNLDFDRANAIKYLARVGHKGDPVEDLEKAAQYLQFYEVRRMYENSLCEQFVNQIDEVPIRHAIRYLFSGEVTLAKMAIDKVLEMYRKPEAKQ